MISWLLKLRLLESCGEKKTGGKFRLCRIMTVCVCRITVNYVMGELKCNLEFQRGKKEDCRNHSPLLVENEFEFR